MSATAEIQRFDRNRDGYVEYFIKVVYNGRQWSIKKRFREFEILNEYLIKDGIHIPNPLPQKFPWRRHDEKMLKLRRKELQLYLDGILKCTPLSSNRLLREFLEIDAGLLSYCKKFPKLLALDNLRSIHEEFMHSVLPVNFPINSSAAGSFNSNHLSMLPTVSSRTFRKSKSLSFTMRSSRSFLRDSFASDAPFCADRKMSTSTDNRHVIAYPTPLAARQIAFLDGTTAIWPYYSLELTTRCSKVDSHRLPAPQSNHRSLTVSDVAESLRFITNSSFTMVRSQTVVRTFYR